MAKFRSTNSYRRKPQKRISSDAFLIVTEGEVTEPEYFSSLCTAMNMTKADVRVYHSQYGTDPINIVRYAEELQRIRRRDAKHSQTLLAYDQVWVVFDQEGPENGRDWKNGLNKARANKFGIVFSNPSFEFWLLLHHRYTAATFVNSAAVETRLKAIDHGYSKQGGQTDFTGVYLPETENAIVNARQLRADHANTGATNPYTDADKLVIKLNLAVQEHNRVCTIKAEWMPTASK